MKIIHLIIILSFFSTYSQVKTPPSSPNSKIIQTIGLTELIIDYSRPSIKGRKIMGGLVPFGKLWRTGANKNTTISFNDEIIINEKLIPKGGYSIFTIPNSKTWDVFLYDNYSDKSGQPLNSINNWNSKMIICKITVPVIPLNNKIETFTISVSDITSDSANIVLEWENTAIKIPLKVQTEKKTMESIKNTLNSSPTAYDLYSAALYFLQENKDLKKAELWINKAVIMDDSKYWMFRQQALILNKLKKKNDAIIAAKKSLKLARKAGDNTYIKMNTKSIAEWSN
jgi:tetratricopeptide (TPR) repeat protein